MSDTVKFVEFGRGGDVVHYGSHSRSSGYGSPERPHAADGKDIPDGTLALDKRAAIDTDAGYRWVFKGPMVDVDLADGELDRCPEPSSIFAAAMAESSNAFGGLLAMHAAHRETSAGPLDCVPIGEYIAGWMAVGARLGEYRNGQIIWQQGELS